MIDISLLGNQVMHQLRELHRMVKPDTRPNGIVMAQFLKDGQAERVLRIEVGHEAAVDLARHNHRYGGPAARVVGVGPTFMGVSLYTVDHLPADEWRIINPFLEN